MRTSEGASAKSSPLALCGAGGGVSGAGGGSGGGDSPAPLEPVGGLAPALAGPGGVLAPFPLPVAPAGAWPLQLTGGGACAALRRRRDLLALCASGAFLPFLRARVLAEPLETCVQPLALGCLRLGCFLVALRCAWRPPFAARRGWPAELAACAIIAALPAHAIAPARMRATTRRPWRLRFIRGALTSWQAT